MKKLPSQRTSYLLGFLSIAALLSLSLYLELVKGFVPCPLCTLQRLCLVSLGVVFLIGTFIKLKKIGRFVLNSLALLIAISGALLSGRQIWLQHHPLGLGSNCNVSFQYMLDVMPLHEALTKVFIGGTECSQVDWQFLQFSLAEWSFVCFIGFLLLITWQFCRKKI